MKAITRLGVMVLIAGTGWGCKKAFTPQVIVTANNYLVVEGVINTGNDSTKIKLSRTVNLTDTALTKFESGATVYVEGSSSGHYNLKETSPGLYTAPVLGIQNSQKCRLHIITSAQKEYTSDFVEISNTPPIDSITYAIKGNGLQFDTYTHDPSNTVRYFRWDFDETWAYVSLYKSDYKAVNGVMVRRTTANDNIYNCYKTLLSKQVLLASTNLLSSSIVNSQPITYVDVASGKIARGYSMLLREYALTKDGFDYWQKLKKNTEELGSIFDAQPSDLRGNIYSVANPDEPVLGFISASNVSSKRIFVDPHNVDLYTPPYYGPPNLDQCAGGSIVLAPAETFQSRAQVLFYQGDLVPTTAFNDRATGAVLGYTYAPIECVDCRIKIKNGTNVKPSYWPALLQ